MYGDTRAEFTMPRGKWTPMLVTPEFRLLAWPTKGLGSEQWVTRVVVSSPTGERFAQVLIKTDLADANRTWSPPGAFQTLEVALGPSGVPLRQVPSKTVIGVDSYSFRGVELGFGRVRGSRGREYCTIMSPSAQVVVVSSSAREFYGEHVGLAHKFAHLDLEIFGLHRPEVLSGVLPELWGLIPVSAGTRAMLKDEPAEPNLMSGSCPAAQAEAVRVLCARRSNTGVPTQECMLDACFGAPRLTGQSQGQGFPGGRERARAAF